MKPQPRIRTLRQARDFVRRCGLCLVFADRRSPLPSLWDAVDLPERQPGESGWGQRIGAVWTWKNQLPADYPDEIFYGKDARGKAVLMTVEHLRKVHYPQHHRPLTACSPLARKLFEQVRIEPMTTPALRQAVLKGDRTQRHAFAKALVELQVTLNIVRCNTPEVTADTWVRFHEQYPGLA